MLERRRRRNGWHLPLMQDLRWHTGRVRRKSSKGRPWKTKVITGWYVNTGVLQLFDSCQIKALIMTFFTQ